MTEKQIVCFDCGKGGGTLTRVGPGVSKHLNCKRAELTQDMPNRRERRRNTKLDQKAKRQAIASLNRRIRENQTQVKENSES